MTRRDTPEVLREDCVDCWHRWRYHGPSGCGAPACPCSEPGRSEAPLPRVQADPYLRNELLAGGGVRGYDPSDFDESMPQVEP